MTPSSPVQDVLFVDSAAIGARLRQARERCGFDVAHVAGELHLRSRQLLALESGDFSGFNSPAFIKGYLRACARLLGENGDELVRLYESTNPAPRPVLTVSPVLAPKVVAARASGKHVLAPSLLLVCLLLAGVFYAYQRGFLLPLSQADVGLENLATLAADPVVSVAVEQGSSDMAMAVSADPVAMPVDMAMVADNATVGATDTANAGSAAVAPVSSADMPAAPVTQTPVLQLSFTGDCWVQLRRDNGDVVHEKLHKAGDTADIDAALPLNVWFGNATVVGMRLHGKDIPVPVRPGYQSARFVLDEDMVSGDFE